MVWTFLALGVLTGCAARPQPQTYPMEEKTPKEPQTAAALSFPYTLPDGLIVEELLCYTGEYWEDGSEERVQNVAGLMVYNSTEQMLRFGAFSVEQEGQSLHFFVYRLPPKSRCLVLEYEKKSGKPEKITACRGVSMRWEYPEFSREQVDYVCLGPRMTVINRDARQLKHVTVWYKRYVQEGDYYLGGVSYAVHLLSLQPEERRSVLPEHYDAANARIVGIELEM